jgi:uncharacterized protein YprB with RNaseH-like and TPR domain
MSEQRNRLRAQLDRLGYGTAKPELSRDDLRRVLRRRKGVAQPVAGSQPPAPAVPSDATAPAEIRYGRLPGGVTKQAGLPKRKRAAEQVDLATSVTGAEEVHAAFGSCYVAPTCVAEVPDAGDLAARFEAQLADPTSSVAATLQGLLGEGEPPLQCQDLIFMDVESTGLTNTPLFLIGVMVWEEGGFVVRQFFARHYAEERAVLAQFIECCLPRRLLVTFNGKSFDFPYIRSRCAANGLPFDLEPLHLDLLHVGRRAWKGQFRDCKLQTLEQHVCGRRRVGDIPGSEIPDAYHAYVRTGNAWEMVDALKHNMLDLVTLADLMTRYPSGE